MKIAISIIPKISGGAIVHPFKEPLGLVVRKTLASGLYVLCSDRAGAGYDLLGNGWNGELFDPHNVEELVGLIGKTKEQLEDIRIRREAISDHACREFSIGRSAEAFLDAIEIFRHNDI